MKAVTKICYILNHIARNPKSNEIKIINDLPQSTASNSFVREEKNGEDVHILEDGYINPTGNAQGGINTEKEVWKPSIASRLTHLYQTDRSAVKTVYPL